MAFRHLAERIEELGTASFEGSAFRHVSPRRDPRSGTGARIHGGRWNPRDSFATVYLGLDEAVVVAEFHRLARRQNVAVAGFLPRELHRFDVRLTRALDLRGAKARGMVGLRDAEVRSDDLGACQKIGAAAHHLGLEGILAPSATSAGTVLALFVDNLLPRSRFEVVALESVWDDAPSLPDASR